MPSRSHKWRSASRGARPSLGLYRQIGGAFRPIPSMCFACQQWLQRKLVVCPGDWTFLQRNPKGISPQSPGLRGTSYPGAKDAQRHNPNGVATLGRCPNFIAGLESPATRRQECLRYHALVLRLGGISVAPAPILEIASAAISRLSVIWLALVNAGSALSALAPKRLRR